jgi:hypothetical protein
MVNPTRRRRRWPTGDEWFALVLGVAALTVGLYFFGPYIAWPATITALAIGGTALAIGAVAGALSHLRTIARTIRPERPWRS